MRPPKREPQNAVPSSRAERRRRFDFKSPGIGSGRNGRKVRTMKHADAAVVLGLAGSITPQAVHAAWIAAAKKYLASIPGIVSFHVGKMVTSHREVVDQTYQVALNIQFRSKQAQDEYQDHPQHLEFVKQCKPLFAKLIIYDFE